MRSFWRRSNAFGPSGLDRVSEISFSRAGTQTRRLVCGRDMFGIRPLAYVHQPAELFGLCSFPKAFYGAGIVAKKVDEDAVARRVALHYDTNDSLIAGIKRLPPAHIIEVSREGISLVRYWRLDRAAVRNSKRSPDAAAHELRRLVDQAVNCRSAAQ